MKVLFLCGVFADENEQEILRNTKTAVEYSANIFQKKLINGFKETADDFEVISAPLIGSFPNAYKKAWFRGFEKEQNEYRYVFFNNVWGIRNFSRAKSLKKALKSFIKNDDKEKLIVVYSVHTPFLEAAAYAKKKDPRIKINIVIPDLPEYMNLNENKSWLYKIGKKYDIKRFNKFNNYADSYVFLTEAMTEKIDTHGCPYIIAEGIVDESQFIKQTAEINEKKDHECKYIVYAGKIYEKFGVKNLVDAFMMIPDEKYRLVLCGKGDMEDYVREKALIDSRITYLGQVSASEAQKWVFNADVLVNPRPNNEEYTKYSFPSKNIEYLMSGKPVVGYVLSGMKACYKDFLCVPKDDSVEALSKALLSALENEQYENALFLKYCKENLTNTTISREIEKL